MSKPYVIMLQKCDFCHKDFEIGNPFHTIELPGIFINSDGTKGPTWCSGSICESCTNKLREKLKESLTINEIEYGGTTFKWKEQVAIATTRSLQHDGEWYCSNCDYEFEGEPSDKCPKCGARLVTE